MWRVLSGSMDNSRSDTCSSCMLVKQMLGRDVDASVLWYLANGHGNCQDGIGSQLALVV